MQQPLVFDAHPADGLVVDLERLRAFEDRFDPARPNGSLLEVLGHGRFMTCFTIEGMETVALKRLPPFPNASARALYERALNAYHMLLRDTVGLNVVEQRCIPITNAAGEYVLYIAQLRQPADAMVDRVLARCSDEEAAAVFAAIVRNVLRVWYRNEIEKELEVPGSVMGLDAQLSNWAVAVEDGRVVDMMYLDTGTPFFRRLDQDHLEPGLFLSGLPMAFARSTRHRYIVDVLTRYYDLRIVLIDLVAGLYAIDQVARVPLALEVVNHVVTTEAADLRIEPITLREVERFAGDDRRYWRRFLSLSRFKRFTSTRIFRRKYPFLLPG